MKPFLRKCNWIGWIILVFIILLFPIQSKNHARDGLMIWFEQSIPTLFPFMILSSILVSYSKKDSNSKYFMCLLSGFFFGFPSGARTITTLYQKGILSLSEAKCFLSFCNNLGPVFLLGIVRPALNYPPLGICLFGMYGIPLIYGGVYFLLIRRYKYGNHRIDKLVYRNISSFSTITSPPVIQNSFTEILRNSRNQITMLGCYMIFFETLKIIPDVILTTTNYLIQSLSYQGLTSSLSVTIKSICYLLLEITGGIMIGAGKIPNTIILSMMHFGGFSCIAQTNYLIQDTELSIKEYVIHKIAQTGITFVFYFLFYEITDILSIQLLQ